MELFFMNSPIGDLIGLIKEDKLYFLSGQNQKSLAIPTEISEQSFFLDSALLASSHKKNVSRTNKSKKAYKEQKKLARNFKTLLKDLDIKKTYLFDLKTNRLLIQSSASPLVKKIKKELCLFFKGELRHFNIPLFQRRTPFQEKVWSFLRKIPYGQTKTYCEIAKQIKKPKAYRAVGTCCAKNPFLIVTPCHRVLSQQGLGGFALGLKVKKQLLELEKKSESSR